MLRQYHRHGSFDLGEFPKGEISIAQYQAVIREADETEKEAG